MTQPTTIVVSLPKDLPDYLSVIDGYWDKGYELRCFLPSRYDGDYPNLHAVFQLPVPFRSPVSVGVLGPR